MRSVKGGQFITRVLLYGISDVAARGIQFLAMLVMARALTKEDYGSLGLVFSIQQLVTTLHIGGMLEAMGSWFNVSTARQRIGDRLASIGALSTISAVCSLVIVAIGSFVVLSTRHLYVDLDVILVAVVGGVCLGSTRIRAGTWQLREQHGVAILWKTIPPLVGFGIAMICSGIVREEDLTLAFFVALAIGFGFPLLFSAPGWQWWKREAPKANWSDVRQLGFESVQYLIPGILAYALGLGANLVIAVALDTNSVAEYTMCFTLGSTGLLVQNAVNQVWAPRLLALHAQGQLPLLNEINLRLNQVVWAAILLVCWFLTELWSPLVDWVGGNFWRYKDLEVKFALIFLGYACFTLNYRSMNFFIANNAGREYRGAATYSTIIAVVFMILATALIPDWGPYIGFVVASLLRGGVLAVKASKWGVTIAWWELPCIAISIAATIALAASDVLSAQRIALQLLAAGVPSIIIIWNWYHLRRARWA